MKRLLSMLCFLTIMLGTKASEPTTDYVYATDLQYDSRKSLYYFDVVLQGNNFYTGYGVDILMPTGLKVNALSSRKGVVPNIVLLDEGMYEDAYGSTEHMIGVSFPYSDDYTHARVGCMSSGNYDMGKTSGSLFRVYVDNTCTETQWPIGSIKLSEVELNKVGAPFVAQDKETVVAMHTGETTLPFNISSGAKWSTCILPFSAAIPEGVKAYTCSRNDEQCVYLSEVESMEAYTPYVLYSENGYSGTISGTVTESGYPETSSVSDGCLYGAIAPQTVTEGYILQKQNDAVKFYAIDEHDSFTIPAGKCWLNIPESTSAKSLSFYTEDMSTGVKATTILPNSNISYDLLGRQQLVGKHGILIMNGTKILK